MVRCFPSSCQQEYEWCLAHCEDQNARREILCSFIFSIDKIHFREETKFVLLIHLSVLHAIMSLILVKQSFLAVPLGAS